MPVIDIIIAVAILISIIVGLLRGFIKEAVSVASLLVAIWAALYFGPSVGGVSESWISSEGLQQWIGRILVFLVVLAIGGLLGWGLSKLIRSSALSGMDRMLGSLFGAGRGILLVAVFVLGAQYAGFSKDGWWRNSALIPHFEVIAEWIKVMAPKGLDLLTPGEKSGTIEVDAPEAEPNGEESI